MKILEWITKKTESETTSYESFPEINRETMVVRKTDFGTPPDSLEAFLSVGEFAFGKDQFTSPRIALDAAIRIIGLITEGAFRNFDDFANIADELRINTKSGDVWIDRSDEATGRDYSGEACIDLRFFAPEAVRGTDVVADYNEAYIAGVLSFMLLTGGQHPLEGSCSISPVLLPEERKMIYGENARFIFDEQDESNKPDPKIHIRAIDAWEGFPAFLKALFRECFDEDKINYPESRPSVKEFGRQLIRYQSGIIPCDCGMVYFAENMETIKCGWCGREITAEHQLSFSGKSIPIVRGSRIYNCQLFNNYEGNYGIAAEIVVSPNDVNKLGIRNKTGELWEAITSKGVIKQVEPEGIIPIKEGIRFRYKDIEISITRHETV